MKIRSLLGKLVRLPLLTFNSLYNFALLKIHNIKIERPFYINGRVFFSNSGYLFIRSNFKANSGKNCNPIGGDTQLRLVVGPGAKLIIGKNVGMSNSTIVCRKSIEIGDNVFIGGGCKIWDTDFHSMDPFMRVHGGDIEVKTAPIIIKDYAFIGGFSIILKGVTIGKNSIIAAGSVVTKSTPDNQIWGGNPAKFIKTNKF